MPFDFIPPAALALGQMPVDAATIHGVPRHELAAHALDQVAPHLRNAVAEIELRPGQPFVHMGMAFEQVAWRILWGQPGLPVSRGSFPVWNGSPV